MPDVVTRHQNRLVRLDGPEGTRHDLRVLIGGMTGAEPSRRTSANNLLSRQKSVFPSSRQATVVQPAISRDHGDGGSRLRAVIVLRLLFSVLCGLGVVLLLLAVAQLENGVREIPEHWWSTAPVALALAAFVVVTATWRPRGWLSHLTRVRRL
jgi:hypothetical protein